MLAFLVLATGLGAFAVWFQWSQTRRCLQFFGPEVAAAIQSSPTVEIWEAASEGGEELKMRVFDVSGAPGLVHLRRGLIEDVNYDWGAQTTTSLPPGPLPSAAGEVVLAFCDRGSLGKPPVVLAIDLDAPGSLAVVGRPGRVTLGRLRSGLAKWVEETRTAVISSEKSGY